MPKISRIENGQLPDIHALRAMLDVYGVIGDEEAPYIELWERAREKGWWKQYHAIIAESALRHADREQLSHINKIGLLPNVTIQVVLDMAGLHDGPFTLLEFPYPGDPQVLYIEHAVRAAAETTAATATALRLR
ncbi:hypothetical protein UK23_19845 [Lentzea aerocolonigenes]|uniref:DUF5753 domain-containing protein n=1 Tax=Lentzea aerocolonigenes TaxID=68170 RepID=A0A0F0H1W4_LENAE|nr:Scr1 family TA system antitoxin-like transcriptional regulator [Lentzea aerocolonigenes]KJK47628.1 hypothetical protein UK23_19845 [Lentzea aerocolonigenes]